MTEAQRFGWAGVLLLAMSAGMALVLHDGALALTRAMFEPGGTAERLPALAPTAWDQPALWLLRPAPFARKAEAAVFFVHGTSYFARDRWNSPFDDPASHHRIAAMGEAAASAYAEPGAIWAPRYREAAFGALLSDRPDARVAMANAEADVNAAFVRFLADLAPGEPLIVAGNDQGAALALRLVRDHVRGTPLAARVVAVYAAGWPVSRRRDLPALGLPACDRPDASGCIAAWMPWAEPADPALAALVAANVGALDGNDGGALAPFTCFDPLTGSADDSASASRHLGSLGPDLDQSQLALERGAISARCDRSGWLMLGHVPAARTYRLPGNGLAAYATTLFWGNLKADVARRLVAWRQRHGSIAAMVRS